MRTSFFALLLVVLVSSLYGEDKVTAEESSIQDAKPPTLPKIQMLVRVIPKSTSSSIDVKVTDTLKRRKDSSASLQPGGTLEKFEKNQNENGNNKKHAAPSEKVNNINIQQDGTPMKIKEALKQNNELIYIEETESEVIKSRKEVIGKSHENSKQDAKFVDEVKKEEASGLLSSWWPISDAKYKAWWGGGEEATTTMTPSTASDVDDEDLSTDGSGSTITLTATSRDGISTTGNGIFTTANGISTHSTTSWITRFPSPSTIKKNPKVLTSPREEYATCNTCMKTNQGHECPNYQPPIQRLHNYISGLTSLLLFGCSGKSYGGGGTICCHDRNLKIEEFLIQTTRSLQEWERTLRQQCYKCPENCRWENWGEWSVCPFTCRPGYNRTRTRFSSGPWYGGQPCPNEKQEESEACPTPKTVAGTWEVWGSWSTCSSKCGGFKSRSPRCAAPPLTQPCSLPCDGQEMQVEGCGDSDKCCVSAKWSPWSEWSICPVFDRTDIRTTKENEEAEVLSVRNRTCVPDSLWQPLCPGQCLGVGTQINKCKHCEKSRLSLWSEWSVCSNSAGTRIRIKDKSDIPRTQYDADSRPCSGGCRKRKRTCIKGTCADKACIGRLTETVACHLGPCCIMSNWSPWTLWSPCKWSSCQTRSRYCHVDGQAGNMTHPRPICRTVGCWGKEPEIETKECPDPCVDGSWGVWGTWGLCGINCTRQRLRLCDNPMPNHCGRRCPGQSSETEPCNYDASWGLWGPWGTCGSNCTQRRLRLCNTPPMLKHCGATCVGLDSDERTCKGGIDGKWGFWSSWTECSASCGPGKQERTRMCDKPKPNVCGKKCQGNAKQIQNCQGAKCCVDGNWSSWGEWSLCSENNCLKQRSRLCNNPIPNFCGRDCEGHWWDEGLCNRVDATWKEWGQWSSCRADCTQLRSRICEKPESTLDSCGRQTCSFGSSSDIRVSCDRAVDGNWGLWSSWSICSVSCGPGVQRRTRKCDNPTPGVCGNKCPGKESQTQDCQGRKCCDSGVWGHWNSWSDCNCDQGRKRRTRSLIPSRPGVSDDMCGESFDTDTETCSCCIESCIGLSDGFHLAKCRDGEKDNRQCGRYIKCCNGELKGSVATCPPGEIFYPGCKACGRGHEHECRLVRSRELSKGECRRKGLTAIDENPCCMEDCTGFREGFFASRCKTDCKTYYKCCEGHLGGDSPYHCGENFYHAQCGCCVRERPASCVNGLETFTGPHSPTPECDWRLCISFPPKDPVKKKKK